MPDTLTIMNEKKRKIDSRDGQENSPSSPQGQGSSQDQCSTHGQSSSHDEEKKAKLDIDRAREFERPKTREE